MLCARHQTKHFIRSSPLNAVILVVMTGKPESQGEAREAWPGLGCGQVGCGQGTFLLLHPCEQGKV